MSATDRLHDEQLFHDRQARQRGDWFARHPEALRFDDNAYLDHETWVRPALAQLGDVRGLPLLDFGCGHGMAAIVLARRRARVTAFDLSYGYLDEARRRADANQADVAFVQADGKRLPFADGAFARIWGNAVLHHLDLCRAAVELRRVLQPGGIAVFCEPWGENPLVNWARRLPRAQRRHTAQERPLRQRDLGALRAIFPDMSVRGFQLVSMVRRLLKGGRVAAGLDWCDRRLLAWFRGLQRFCRYVVLTLRKSS